MITVKYGKPKKIKGIGQSIFVSFRYNQTIVNAIRMITPRYWHANDKVWELSYDSLSELKELLPREEFDIQGKPIDKKKYKEKEVDHSITLPKALKTKLFPYQKETFDEGMAYDKYIYNLQQGLGKSLCTLATVVKRMELGQVNKCLVIVGINGLKFTWEHEIEKHLVGYKCKILGNRQNSKGVWQTKGSKEKLEDLKIIDDDIQFYITNIETIRDKKITDRLVRLLDKGVFNCIVVDEAHKCFDYNTKITTNKGSKKIGDIVENNLDVLVASYNERTNAVEYKPIINRYKNLSRSNQMELTFSYPTVDGRKITRNVICSEEHLFYTKNRGYVQAKDLTSEDELVQLFDKDLVRTCDYCNKPLDITNGAILHGSRFCSRSCAFKYGKQFIDMEYQREVSRKNLKKLWQDSAFAKKCAKLSSERMRKNNPVYMDGVVERATQTRIQNGSYKNNFRYGNGKISPHEQIMLDFLQRLGFKYNYAINTKDARLAFPSAHYPNSYKPDFTNTLLRLCIEVDGDDHKKKKKHLLDIKKDKCLDYLGYKVLRYSHEEIDDFVVVMRRIMIEYKAREKEVSF